MELLALLDTAISQPRFNISQCIDIESRILPEEQSVLQNIKPKLTPNQYKALKCSIVRNSFLIEPVNAEITSTKVETHWSQHLQNDVRFSSFLVCYEIFKKILRQIDELRDTELNILKDFLDNSLISYEIPVDYISRTATPIHSCDNVSLFFDDTVRNCAAMRNIIRNKTNDQACIDACRVFEKILSEKIKVKTYLTDRAQTGLYQTNREKRWETHPNSVQYALRRDCMRIETKLLLQVATFEGCYPQLVALLQSKGLLPQSITPCKCPITGIKINYQEFENDTLHPTHGRSKFQVGHLNPLKAQDNTGTCGHTADNISWISEDGNRIQGSLSLSETDDLLKKIYQNRPELHQ